MTNDLNNLIDRYIEAWNETDGARRRELVAGTWSEDGTYLDPLMSGSGHDSIVMIGLGRERFPAWISAPSPAAPAPVAQQRPDSGGCGSGGHAADISYACAAQHLPRR